LSLETSWACKFQSTGPIRKNRYSAMGKVTEVRLSFPYPSDFVRGVFHQETPRKITYQLTVGITFFTN